MPQRHQRRPEPDAHLLGVTSGDIPGTQPRGGRPGPSRRDLLRLSLAAGVMGPAALSLDACARKSPATATPAPGVSGSGSASPSPTGLPIASPTNPITWPIAAGNQPVAAGQTPEKGAVLQLYNYADYIDPAAIKGFEKKYAQYGVKVKVSTFNDSNEALSKIRAGAVPYDIYFPSYDALGKLVLGGLIRPLTHDYMPNIANVWPEFTNPFYDGEWRYSVPYTVYTTGIAWRTDRIKEDVGARPNPWDVFWDPQFAGKLSVLDDYRETISMALLRNGITDVNTGDEADLAKAQDQLLAMTAATHPTVTITDYSDLPGGRFAMSLAWSGDAVNMPYYLPKGVDPGILRYWFPQDGRGVVNNDLMVVLTSGKYPVTAHLFIDYMLQTDVAMANMSAIGYQPPQVSVTPAGLVKDGYIPENLKPATVLPQYFASGYRTLELAPDVDARWQSVWQRFKAGA